ncbi:hypothetical protein [Paenibacillus sp. FSL P2-0173]|uniref:hypothetical protein n=1 Tax=Paenibacillus sp. FSL P2-0173 TaxID=2921627 RepID=UPI0030FCA06D
MEPVNQIKNERKKTRINWRIVSIYPLVLASILLFGLFIYPTMYKYDKLDQKYPVMINRFTGEAKILTQNGWQNTPDIDSALGKMEQYKGEISMEIDKQKEEITQNVMAAIEGQLDEIKTQSISVNQSPSESEFAEVRNRDRGTFGKGDSMDSVEKVMGTADTINYAGPFERWFYGNSSVSFKDGKVNGWSNLDGNLLLK